MKHDISSLVDQLLSLERRSKSTVIDKKMKQALSRCKTARTLIEKAQLTARWAERALSDTLPKADHPYDGRTWDETDTCVQCGLTRDQHPHLLGQNTDEYEFDSVHGRGKNV